MKKDDAQKLDHATLEALRNRAVQSVQEGESCESPAVLCIDGLLNIAVVDGAHRVRGAKVRALPHFFLAPIRGGGLFA